MIGYSVTFYHLDTSGAQVDLFKVLGVVKSAEIFRVNSILYKKFYELTEAKYAKIPFINVFCIWTPNIILLGYHISSVYFHTILNSEI